ncbi:MAG: TIGR02147 family protein [Bdellovibrionaceae bacterium]|nr:TIGR02147 family protein [Pseudobdellovibrionaceae bacterium]
MSIYSQWNYRAFLASECQALKTRKPGFTLQKLAHKTSIQPPYLTNVFKERAHLSADQSFAIGHEIGLADEELDYLLLLLEWERSGSGPRKQKLKAKLENIRREKLKSKAHLQKEIVQAQDGHETRFFLNPYYKVINAFLGVERYAKDPGLLATALNLSPRQVDQWLKDLVEMGFVRKTPQGFEKLKRNFHLPKESPLCLPHQNLLAQISTRQQHGLPDDEKFNFAVTFSADAETREKIQREFLSFLKKIEGLVKDAPAQEVYGLSFDLFRWSAD